jgi:hypothetical protein
MIGAALLYRMQGLPPFWYMLVQPQSQLQPVGALDIFSFKNANKSQNFFQNSYFCLLLRRRKTEAGSRKTEDGSWQLAVGNQKTSDF